MPLQYTIDHSERFVQVNTNGVVVLSDILTYYDALVVEGAMPYRKLFDASDVDLRLSDDDIMALGAWVSAYAAMDPRGPIAIVAVGDETRDLMRRYMNLGGAKRPVKLFSTVATARKWLDAQPAV